MRFLRPPVIVIAVVMLAACSGVGKPGASAAKRDLQQWLDVAYPGVWNIRRVEKVNGQEAVRNGTAVYIFEARVQVRVLKGVTTVGVGNGLQLAYDMVAKKKYWVADLLGTTGEDKTLPLQLLYIKKDRGWDFAGVCEDCDAL